MKRISALLILVLAASAAAAFGGVFLKSDKSTYDPFIIVHPPGYTGAGGELTVKICTTSGSEMVISSLRQAIEIWNSLIPTMDNCQGECRLWEEPLSAGFLSMSSVLLHELGHCAFGLGHINLGSTSFTNSRDSVSIDPGVDGVRGSHDDIPSPLPGTRVIHWFRTADNDPFVIDATVIDGSTYTRRIIDLPPGHTWQASGNRGVGDLQGLNATQSIMYDSISGEQFYRGLVADDVNTVKYGMSGLDFQPGTADDYTVRVVFQADCSTADIEVEAGTYPDITASCISTIAPIETIHYRVTYDPLIFDRLVIQVNSLESWADVFYEGFESGDVSWWSSATP